MIEGRVSAWLEATVTLEIQGPRGRSLINAVVDTGYSDFLTLPPAEVGALGLRYKYPSIAELADGSEIAFDVYDAELFWGGQLMAIPVDESASAPLVGMALLEGHSLHLDIERGGRVLIEPLAA